MTAPYWQSEDGRVLNGGLELLFGLPTACFTTVVADPPWDYRDPLQRGRHSLRGAESHYPLMKLGLIMSLPVRELSRPNSHLYLWVPNAFMVEGHQVAAAWGFSIRTIITWWKRGIGMGHFFRNNTEHVLFCVRGRLETLRHDCPTAYHWPKGAHSEKPEDFFRLVESMSPGPYLELFGRRGRPDWTVWGDEAGKFPTQLFLPATEGIQL